MKLKTSLQKCLVTLVILGSMPFGLLTQAEELQSQSPGESKGAEPVPARIQKQRQQAKWMVPLLTAQYCAYHHALQAAQRLAQSWRHISQEQGQDDTRPYQDGMNRVERELAAFGKKPGDCQGKVTKTLIPCLPSVEPLRRKGLGFEYVREWCRSEPYLTYEELEMGHESPYRNPPKRLDMQVVANTIRKALHQRNIYATVNGFIGGRSQILEIVLQKGATEQDVSALLDSIIAEHKDLLKRGLYRDVTVYIEGSLDHFSRTLPE